MNKIKKMKRKKNAYFQWERFNLFSLTPLFYNVSINGNCFCFFFCFFNILHIWLSVQNLLFFSFIFLLQFVLLSWNVLCYISSNQMTNNYLVTKKSSINLHREYELHLNLMQWFLTCFSIGWILQINFLGVTRFCLGHTPKPLFFV